MLLASGASPLQTDATARSVGDAEADGIRTVGLSYLPTYCDHVACGKVVATPSRSLPAAAGHRGRRRRQRVLPSGVRSRTRAARRGRPRMRRRCAGDQPLVLGRRARMVRGATRRATARRVDVRQLLVADGARRRRPPVLRDESDRVGRPRRDGRRSWPTCRRRPWRGCGSTPPRRPGEHIPLGWALDADGRPTTDAKAGARRFDGAGRRPQGLGTGVARRSDVRRGGRLELLVRGVGLRRRAGGPPDVGQVVLAIDPTATMGDDFVDRIEHELRTLSAEPGVRLPGDRRLEHRRSASATASCPTI